MLSDKQLLRGVDKALIKHPEIFEDLLEFERTGKLPTRKERFNFTINSRLMDQFRAYCRKKGLKFSTKIEQLIEKELECN